jgi:HTH-type transcriptional regulator/antitoxin HigA
MEGRFTMKELIPAEVFAPGEFIKEELEARGWTQDDLADIMARPVRLINEIIAAKRGITPETAKGLGDAFDTGAQCWMNLESAYRLSHVRTPDNPVQRRAAIYGKAPIRHMIRRFWIESSENIDVLESRLRSFFITDNLDEIPSLWAMARKSAPAMSFSPAQGAWLYRAKHLAQAVTAAPFSDSRFSQGMDRLRGLLASPEDIQRIAPILAEAGIRFLIVEPLPQTRIDGVCFWLNSKSPVVVLSLRYDRIDWFWHTLMHELAHLHNKDGIGSSNDIPLDTNLVGEQATPSENKPLFEKEADKLAVEFLVPQAKLNDFIDSVHPVYSKKRIEEFAAAIKVHPGIVVGQLQHRNKISYAYYREALVKIRHIVTGSALTDGWGYSPSSFYLPG